MGHQKPLAAVYRKGNGMNTAVKTSGMDNDMIKIAAPVDERGKAWVDTGNHAPQQTFWEWLGTGKKNN